ncbi:MAG: hypothetical protein LUI05_03085 [Oscillospiraceae bacterium]|nr:hypothetical protein [Oscillospiraceae bacterium]
MTLSDFKNLLLQLSGGVKVYHNLATKIADNYVVWYEVGRDTLRADNGAAEYAYIVGVDYYTKSEYSTTPDEIEELFAAGEVAYSDVTIIFEEDTGFTHFAWTCYV